MDSFFERERHDGAAQAMYQVITEEHFRHYTVKHMRQDGLDSFWVFRDGTLRGVLQWTEMLSLSDDHQYILRFPNAFDGLVFAEWVPEPGAMDDDEAVAISRLERYYFQAFPADRQDGILFRGSAVLTLEDELDACTVTIGGIPFATFVSAEDGMRLIDARSSARWGYSSEFQTLCEEDVSLTMVAVAQYVYEYLISQLPHVGATVH